MMRLTFALPLLLVACGPSAPKALGQPEFKGLKMEANALRWGAEGKIEANVTFTWGKATTGFYIEKLDTIGAHYWDSDRKLIHLEEHHLFKWNEAFRRREQQQITDVVKLTVPENAVFVSFYFSQEGLATPTVALPPR